MKRAGRRSGATLTRTCKLRAGRAVAAGTGEAVSEAALLERAGWLCGLLGEAAQAAVDRGWSQEGLDALLDPELPAFAYRALERAHGRIAPPPGVHLDSRAAWMAGELAGRLLRAQNHQRLISEAMIGGAELPGFVSGAEARNLRRELRGFEREHGRPAASFFDLRPSGPRAGTFLAPLACTDRQFAEWEQITAGMALLRVKLPLCARPQSRKDWAWHLVEAVLPGHLRARLAAGACLARPSLRVSGGRVLLDLVTDQPAPRLPEGPARAVFSCDWGERRLLTAADLWTGPDGAPRTSGRPAFFCARGMQAKLGRLRRQAGFLRSKIDRLETLLAGNPDPALQARLDRLEDERARVWRRYHHASRQLAHAGARWMVEHAKILGADTIALEDLRSLEARFPSSSLNGRINHQVRGLMYAFAEHKAREAGIRVAYVSARGTSAACPRCQGAIRHHKAPDDPARGRGWGTCERCRRSADRDHAAAEHVGLRAIASEPHGRLRQSSRPALHQRPGRRQRHSKHKTPRPRSARAGAGRAVRPGGTPRTTVSITAWPQRPAVRSHTALRELRGLRNGYTARVRLTLTRAKPTTTGTASARTPKNE